MNASEAGLRETQKAARRRDVIVAAAKLWRKRGVDGVSIPEIARAAEVAPQTIYNLIGGRHAVVFATIEDGFDRFNAAFAAQRFASGLEQARLYAKQSALAVIADAKLYRQLIVRVPLAVFEGAEFGRDGTAVQRTALERARKEGAIRKSIALEAAAAFMYQSYLGTLYGWGCGSLGDVQFAAMAELSAASALASLATVASRFEVERSTDRLLKGLAKNME